MEEIQEKWVRSLGQEDALGQEMAAPFSALAWRIPGTEGPGGLQPPGSQESDTTEESEDAHTQNEHGTSIRGIGTLEEEDTVNKTQNFEGIAVGVFQ